MGARSQHQTDFLLILTLFISFRLLTLTMFTYGGFFGPSSDYDYYLKLGELSRQGIYPFLDFWMEYPPVFPWLAVVAYQLALLVPGHPPLDTWFRIILGCCLLAFEVGNLSVVYRIGRRLYGPSGALRCAWIYGALFAPLFVWSGWFDTLPVFLTLLSLDLLLARRLFLAGLASGLGFAVKLIPSLVGLVAARTLVGHAPSRRRLDRLGVYAAGAVAAALICLAPFALLNWPIFALSARSWLLRAPWETFWAMADGYFSFGAVATLPARLTPAASLPWQRETTSAGPWPALCLALVFVWLYARRFEVSRPRSIVAFAGLAFNALILLSSGFSPQFVAWLMPFIVLLLPTLRGAAYATALTVVSLFVERYVYFSMFPDQRWLLWVVVVVRSLLLLTLSAEYYSLLEGRFGLAWERLRARAVPATAAGSLLLALGTGAALTAEYAATGHEVDRPVLMADELKTMVPAEDPIIFTDGDLYTKLYPHLMDRPVFLLSERALASVGGATPEQAIREIGRRYPWPHVVITPDRGGALGTYLVNWLGRYGYLVKDSRFAGGQVLAYALPQRLSRASEVPDHPQIVNFGNEISLVGYTVRDEGLVLPGQSVEVSLFWRATRRPTDDYTLVVRLLDSDGAILARHDRQPVNGHLPTSSWVPGELVIDDHRLVIGSGAPAGRYRLEVGWRNKHTDGTLSVVGGTSASSSDVALLQSVEIVEASVPSGLGDGQ